MVASLADSAPQKRAAGRPKDLEALRELDRLLENDSQGPCRGRKRSETLPSMASTDPHEYLTVAEVAAVLKLNQQTVRSWIDRGELPPLRVDRRVRILRSDFDALIQNAGGHRRTRLRAAGTHRSSYGLTTRAVTDCRRTVDTL
jgi:excisionase family DNA binding protein